MRGLVERTRVAVVEVAGKDMGSVTDTDAGAGGNVTETDEDDFNVGTTDDDDDNDDLVMEGMRVEGNHGRWEMEVARVYEMTIVELGMALDDSNGFG